MQYSITLAMEIIKTQHPGLRLGVHCADDAFICTGVQLKKTKPELIFYARHPALAAWPKTPTNAVTHKIAIALPDQVAFTQMLSLSPFTTAKKIKKLIVS